MRKLFISTKHRTMYMARLRCGNCNYVFEPKIKSRMPEKCPYCDVGGNLFEEKSILDSLDESSDEE